ncbi:hypothetical protein B0H10DRAFT_2222758 [Mycena sp. CBHHK59/15]|nr:hypothetical protein B0H10DRAFT_2222758 [Mycena sp. CBHHK59/15]
MPTLTATQAANALYRPAYVPVAVFAGGTSGVGAAMARAFARGLPKPARAGEWAHEFVRCEATEMANVHTACAGLRARLGRINYLVLSAGSNTMTWAGETREGLDYRLSLRWYSHFVYIQELAPLLAEAAELGQDARVMSVLGAGFGVAPPDGGSQQRQGARALVQVAEREGAAAPMRGMIIGVTLNDALIVWFAAQYPKLVFTHIHPGMVRTPTFKSEFANLGWLLAPLTFVLFHSVNCLAAVEEDACAEWMLHPLLDPACTRGPFIANRRGDVLSSYVFPPESRLGDSSRKGFVNGVPLKCYGGSDAVVKLVCGYAEEVLARVR